MGKQGGSRQLWKKKGTEEFVVYFLNHFLIPYNGNKTFASSRQWLKMNVRSRQPFCEGCESSLLRFLEAGDVTDQKPLCWALKSFMCLPEAMPPIGCPQLMTEHGGDTKAILFLGDMGPFWWVNLFFFFGFNSFGFLKMKLLYCTYKVVSFLFFWFVWNTLYSKLPYMFSMIVFSASPPCMDKENKGSAATNRKMQVPVPPLKPKFSISSTYTS